MTLPTQYVLGDARPNPFNPKTVISYELPQTSQVQLVIYDVAGRVVRTLVDGQRPAGSHGAEWDGRDDGGRPVGSGIYFYAMRAGAWQSQKRLTVLK
jgi:flagellar hook assembly protein FlgD